jgi:hypothetical protein
MTILHLLLLRTWLSCRHGVVIDIRRAVSGRMMIDARRTGKSGVHKHLHIADDTDQHVLRTLRRCAADLVSDEVFTAPTAMIAGSVPSRAGCGSCRPHARLAA